MKRFRAQTGRAPLLTNALKRFRQAADAAPGHVEVLEGRMLFASVTGALIQYQPIQVDFAGPSTSETATAPNPFTDYRLQVTFQNAASGESFSVPGFFDGDGNGGGSGNVWRARFTPDQPGNWTYTASFRTGSNVAISLSSSAGSATSFNGESGSFSVANRDSSASGFLAHGRLQYVGGYYFQMQDGTYWVKGESNSPENYLGYQGFDGTSAGPYGIHKFANHVQDWNAGDPDWGNGKGKAIIGSLNYLASTGINGIYVMPMNIGGDGQDAWPFVGPINRAGSTSNDDLHYDISKLAQWNTFFSYANAKGIQVQLVLDETEEANKRELDNAQLGTERSVYYREMVARFGYLNALEFNVSEEYDHKYDLGYDRVLQFAGYIQDQDPYDHPITVMSRNDPRYYWKGFLDQDAISSTSFQFDTSPVRDIDIVPGTARYGADVEDWRKYSSDAGKKLPINIDEPGTTTTDNQVSQRKQLDYQTFFSGGAGLGVFGGKALDRSLDDFRTFDDSFKWLGYAVKFVQQNLPFWQMSPSDSLLTGESSTYGGGQVFAKTNDTYAIYYPEATSTGKLDLSAANGTFNATWFNPRTGQFEGSTTSINGGGSRTMPTPPSSKSEDWVLLLKKGDSVNQAPQVDAGPDRTVSIQTGASLDGTVSDDGLPAGSPLTYAWSMVSGPGNVQFGNANLVDTTASFSATGTYVLKLMASDGQLAASDSLSLNVVEQSATDPVTFSAKGDAYVQGGASADLNFGTGTGIQTKLSSHADDTRRGLVQFDISSFAGTAGSVKLRLSGHLLDTRVSSLATDIYGTSNPTWNESSVTWNTQPAATGSKLATMTVAGTTAKYYEVDVTNFVKSELAAGRTTVGFLLKNPSSSSPYTIFDTRESGAGTAPQLVITPSGTVTPPTPGPMLTSLSLMNASTDQPVAGFESLTGGTVNMQLSTLPAGLTFLANYGSSILGSVQFTYDSLIHTENTAPYSLGGDKSGDLAAFAFTTGTHTLRVRAYDGPDATGNGGNTITLTLNIT